MIWGLDSHVAISSWRLALFWASIDDRENVNHRRRAIPESSPAVRSNNVPLIDELYTPGVWGVSVPEQNVQDLLHSLRIDWLFSF